MLYGHVPFSYENEIALKERLEVYCQNKQIPFNDLEALISPFSQ